MVINSSVSNNNPNVSTNSLTLAAFTPPSAPPQDPTVEQSDKDLSSIGAEPSPFESEEAARRSVDSATQSMLNHSHLAVLSQGNLSSATVFSLLQD